MAWTSSAPFAPPAAVPWRSRHIAAVLVAAYLATFGLIGVIGFVVGVQAALRGGSLDATALTRLFSESPWVEAWYVMHALVTATLLWSFILKPLAVDVRGFFRRSTPSGSTGPGVPLLARGRVPASVAVAPRITGDVRAAGRLVLLALLATAAVVATVAVALVLSSPMSHQDPAASVAAYVDGMRRENAQLLHPEIGWLRILIVVVLAPIFEELVFRGCLYASLRRRLAALPANLLSSAVFAVAHPYMLSLPNVMIIGVLSAYAYERTRSLRVPVAFHILWNLLGVLSVKPGLALPVAAIGLIGVAVGVSRAVARRRASASAQPLTPQPPAPADAPPPRRDNGSRDARHGGVTMEAS
jgi:membrane protease YdiL (CAAX protease family)